MNSTLFAVEFRRWLNNRPLLAIFALFAILGAVLPLVDWPFLEGARMSPMDVVLLASSASSLALLTAGTCAASNLTEQMRQPLAGWVMSLPIRTRDLVGVRFLLTVASIFTPILLFVAAAAVVNFVVSPQQLSAFNNLRSSILGVLLIGIPNSLTGAAFILFVATLTRRTEAVVVATFITITASSNWLDMIDPAVGVLLDPSGHYPFSEQLHLLLRNFSVKLEDVPPSVDATILLNRLICLAMGGLLLGLAATITRRGRRLITRRQQQGLAEVRPSSPRGLLPSVARPAAQPSQVLEICRLTLRLRLADPLYWFILGTGLLFLWSAHVHRGTTEAPVPLFGSFGNQMFGAFAFLHVLMLIFFAVSSRFDASQRNLGQISLTLPVIRAVWLGGWLLALVIASALFQTVGGLANLALQAYYMPQAITLSGHLQADLLSWVEPLLLGSMTLAVCCFIGAKRTAALVIGLLLLAKLLIGACGEPYTLFSPGWMPDIWWSDFTGFELGLRRWCCYALYWLSMTWVLLIIAARAGKQGPSPPGARHSVAVTWWPLAVPVIASIVFAVVVYASSSRVAKQHARGIQARYETLYRHIAGRPQPRLTRIAGQLSMDTSHGEASGNFQYTLRNDTDNPITRFNLDWTPVRGYAISAAGCRNDDETGFAMCALSKTLLPGAKQSLAVHVSYHHPFGSNETGIGYVTHTAAFLESEFFPLIGYDPLKEIQDARHRSSAGLRGPALVTTDARAGVRTSAFHAQDPLEIDLHVHPLHGLTVIAPRHQIAQVTGLVIVAGQLESTRAVSTDGVAVTLYHHPLHTNMLSTISGVAKRAIHYGVENFGTPGIHDLRIVETDMRRKSGECLPDTILLSEGIVFNPPPASGWNSMEEIPAETVGHEIAHLWWAYAVVPAMAPGLEVITESFSQYMSLMLRRHAGGMLAEMQMLGGGPVGFKSHAKSDADPTNVLSAMQDTPDLAYGRGLVVMSNIEKIIGEPQLNHVLRRFRQSFDVHNHPGRFATLGDFRKLLDEQLSGEERTFVDSMFDTDERLTNARWAELRKLREAHMHRSRSQGTGDAQDR